MRLEVSPAAETDLIEIASFIARDNPPRALTFVDELEAACTRLVDHPHSGVARSDLRPGLRSRPYGSYVIFYTVQETVLRVERILHGSRDIGGPLSPI
ncbi:type II toxin-antitoxin system RelE/ParE family toxin (plasmid) [Brevundimonas staleyi]|uniref:Type II toxin-antitoxin system RelE/ParE family toxin n=1 Tax=Brevundimonas staleyi TaxID=74326 RepID=A0ABW0FNJ6_9CAUL